MSDTVMLKDTGAVVLTDPTSIDEDSERGSVSSDRPSSVGSAVSATLMKGDGGMLSGYLSKKTRDGRWQKRWFETSGVYLTYYKSRKKEKLLAALSLPQVGDITPISADMDGGDKRGGLFSLALDGRLYTLRAQDDDVALDWCVGLQAVKQAAKQTMMGKSQNTNPMQRTGPPSPVRPQPGLGVMDGVTSDTAEFKKTTPANAWCCC